MEISSRHHIAEILLMLALNTNQSIIETYSTCSKYVNYYTTKAVKKLWHNFFLTDLANSFNFIPVC
jgi:hypothetical protein